MTDSAEHNVSLSADAVQIGMERRIYLGMCAGVGLAVVLSAGIAPWRVTSGLLIGGMLSLVNYRWLSSSIASAFGTSVSAGTKPNLRLLNYALRYFVVVMAIAAAQLLNVASLVAMLAGLCSFAVGALVEAFAQTYFIVFHRKETK